MPECKLPSPHCLSPASFRCFHWVFLVGFLLIFLQPGLAGPKQDKFQGKVIYAGPKAISVQSLRDIYLVRSFNYTAKLEQKINSKRPPQGKKVTIHYLRGTDIAVRVD